MSAKVEPLDKGILTEAEQQEGTGKPGISDGQSNVAVREDVANEQLETAKGQVEASHEGEDVVSFDAGASKPMPKPSSAIPAHIVAEHIVAEHIVAEHIVAELEASIAALVAGHKHRVEISRTDAILDGDRADTTSPIFANIRADLEESMAMLVAGHKQRVGKARSDADTDESGTSVALYGRHHEAAARVDAARKKHKGVLKKYQAMSFPQRETNKHFVEASEHSLELAETELTQLMNADVMMSEPSSQESLHGPRNEVSVRVELLRDRFEARLKRFAQLDPAMPVTNQVVMETARQLYEAELKRLEDSI